MDTIDLNALLKTIKKAVSDQNSQVPTILVTGDSKFLVDVIRAEYSSCYSVCGHPQDESKSYCFLKPAECDLYYFVYTHFNEFGDLQYAIDIATKGHKPSFIILDNNSEYKYFPKDILEKYPTFSVSLMNSLFPPLQKFVDSLNSSIRDTLPEYAWIQISLLWKHEFSRLYLGKDFITLGENSPIFNQKKWENWYNDEVSKLEKFLSGHSQIKLPGFPVRYVSSFPSEKDRMQIVKEQLVMSAIEGALASRCNPEAIVKPLLEFFDIDNYVCPNQELYLRECLKEAKGFEMLSTYHQLISILIEKYSHSTSLKYSDELEQLLVDTYQSVKVEEAKVEDSIILLLDIATRIRNLRDYNIKGDDGYFVKRAKELSVVSEVSVDLAKQIEDMAKPYIEEENEFMMNCLNLDSIEYSDELKSNLII